MSDTRGGAGPVQGGSNAVGSGGISVGGGGGGGGVPYGIPHLDPDNTITWHRYSVDAEKVCRALGITIPKGCEIEMNMRGHLEIIVKSESKYK